MGQLTTLGKILHEEHFRILVVINGLDARITGDGARRPLDPSAPDDRELMEELVEVLEGTLRHHAFEESVLFPLIWDEGVADLAVLLTHEHVALGPIAKRMKNLTRATLIAGTTEDSWEEYREGAEELVSQMMSHLQKEEMTVIQHLGTLLDGRVDKNLAHQYAPSRA